MSEPVDWKKLAIDAVTRLSEIHQQSMKRKYPEAMKEIWPGCIDIMKERKNRAQRTQLGRHTRMTRFGNR